MHFPVTIHPSLPLSRVPGIQPLLFAHEVQGIHAANKIIHQRCHCIKRIGFLHKI